MDTKWNRMKRGPSEGLRPWAAGQVTGEPAKGAFSTALAAAEKKGRWGIVSFLAFFLGISLMLGSLAAALGKWAQEGCIFQWWRGDWQETAAFCQMTSQYLEEFLTLGAGGELTWYRTDAVAEDIIQDSGAFARRLPTDAATSTNSSTEMPLPNPTETNPDYNYENDKNILYRIYRDGLIHYENTTDPIASSGSLPEGYNFLLIYRGGKVTAWKDGQQLDIYGNGIYDEDSLWFVPGYQNFSAGENVENVEVRMAVRQKPIQYFLGDGANGSTSTTGQIYWLYHNLQESQAFYRNALLLFGTGVVLTVLWRILRRDRILIDRKIAAFTRCVPTEARILLIVFLLACLLVGGHNYVLWYEYDYEASIYEGSHWYFLKLLIRDFLLRLGDHLPALLALVWSLWLICCDHRCNPKEQRWSLLRLLQAKEMEYPLQKRLSRSAVLRPLMIWGCVLLFLLMAMVPQWFYLFFAIAFVVLLALSLQVLWARRDLALARDFGLLVNQVEAIRSGDLDHPLELPENSDLRQAAEQLNDIQSGMRQALAEQTRSERLKVELVSNVSHDLKTPLTSILSYAELLRQEDLPPAAADYARVIDEKAQRLKAMVQDVFDVSKAAAGQLPVNLERLDLAKLLRQTLADLDVPIQKSRLTFKADLPAEPVEIIADGKRLYRVFQNLIDNALKYALEGSRVYLTLRTEEGYAQVMLRNTSQTELPEGVDFTARFVRGDPSRTDGGSGLGLSIASSFTEACGGSFRVETLADLFTAVVTLPLAGEPS